MLSGDGMYFDNIGLTPAPAGRTFKSSVWEFLKFHLETHG
jgi:hypothetical protein